ncbi:MAG TPA: addiction module toxin, HicA family [Candidatus Diapherotrites archaeon]|uniref:Addiction module toxin, HicA family n=1 Tax=Candidatus Iainarchaeum sp. TaxID=3101447 RepID=A0A7J4JFP6_9ARCH|nr:type II toxin-antitoxin system HicA family toxin [Candidatus Diapherotrites archaeon]HIH15940.1 addiction module toxin, HicA family [Candidatus Diapherotrites archaeon]
MSNGHLPPVKPKKLIKALAKIGIVPVRYSKGSHVQLAGNHKGQYRHTTVSLHGGGLPLGTLKGILTDCGLTREEFFRLLEG